MVVACGGTQLEAIAFGMAEREIPDRELEMAFSVRENVFMGRHTLQLHVKDWR